MSWLDLVAMVLLIAGVVVGSMRGFGRALFDAIALVISAKVATMLYAGLADSMTLSQNPHANQALCMMILFVVVGAITVVVGNLIQNSLLLSLDAFDPILGAILGLPAAGAVVYVLVGIMIAKTGGADAPTAQAYVNSWAAYHFYYFNSYHSMIETFRHIGD